MSRKNRKNKSTSFDLTDEYELELLKYAEEKENGKFSRYIKRLIAQDRDSLSQQMPPTLPKPERKEEISKAMSGFL